jgi:hypothetical protein
MGPPDSIAPPCDSCPDVVEQGVSYPALLLRFGTKFGAALPEESGVVGLAVTDITVHSMFPTQPPRRLNP